MNEIVYDSLMHHASISFLPFMQLKNMYSTLNKMVISLIANQ